MVEKAIVAQGLVKVFPGKRAIDGVDLCVNSGEIVAILGPNGSGKTTLIRMLATLSKPTEGSVEIFGKDTVQAGAAVRTMISLTGQYASVDADLTAWENLVIFGRLNGLKPTQAQARAKALLEEFSLLAVENQQVKTFSGGMHRRLDIAAGLIAYPRLVFLDEPTTGLDPRTRSEMWTVIRQLVGQGVTVVLTTQYLQEADQLADHIVIIDQGKVVAKGTPDSLKAHLQTTKFEVTLADPQQIKQAARITTAVAKDAQVSIVDSKKLRLTSDDVALMAQVLASLTEHHIGIRDFNKRRPTMDDVFLRLTGQ